MRRLAGRDRVCRNAATSQPDTQRATDRGRRAQLGRGRPPEQTSPRAALLAPRSGVDSDGLTVRVALRFAGRTVTSGRRILTTTDSVVFSRGKSDEGSVDSN